VTVTIERTGYDYGVIDASPAEWALIEDLVRHAESVYYDIELLYSIPGPEDQRRGKLRRLIEDLGRVRRNTTVELSREAILLIATCVRRLDGEDVPDVDEAAKHVLVDRLHALEVHDIFDDDFATPEQLARWRAGRSQ